MTKKLTKEEFIAREPDLVSGEYEFVGEYVNAGTKTLFKHNKCGYEWEIQPNNFYVGKRCPECAKKKMGKAHQLTKEEFCKREKDIVSGEYEFIGEYEKSNTKALFRHTLCGTEWNIKPNNFAHGKRCPKCQCKKTHDKQRFDKDFFCERTQDIKSGEYSLIGEYINNGAKTLFKHNACGYEWLIAPSNFTAKHRCPRCAGVERLSKETFCSKESDINSGEYTMLGDYKNAKKKTLFKHNVCGFIWSAPPSGFQSGRRCPRCNESRGERVISDFLQKKELPFIRQKRFPGCHYKRELPFDFYVNDDFLIEFDGRQHYMSVDHFGGEVEFEKRKRLDSIKTQWARDNNIPLIRIPYTEFDNTEQIVTDAINKYCKQKIA